ncbi:acyltransferase [Arenibacter latericius]|uniref:acyltransferase n=1 Tax=Arenibacter latericius TaxID=86104 RepID=UPI00041454F2|nr:acyltransferase [Arenibacter latericius]
MKIIKTIIGVFIPFLSEYKCFSKAKLQASYVEFLKFKIGVSKIYWPVHKTCTVANVNKIYTGVNCLIGRPGAYLQGAGELYIGNYVQIAPNVGILTANHDLYDQRVSNINKVIIGEYSWVGMNSVILPGVSLGTRTIVAAGSIVTKSFPDGFCVIGGNPAKVIKQLDKVQFMPWKDEVEFYGYIPKEVFERNYPERVRKLENELNQLNNKVL